MTDRIVLGRPGGLDTPSAIRLGALSSEIAVRAGQRLGAQVAA